MRTRPVLTPVIQPTQMVPLTATFAQQTLGMQAMPALTKAPLAAPTTMTPVPATLTRFGLFSTPNTGTILAPLPLLTLAEETHLAQFLAGALPPQRTQTISFTLPDTLANGASQLESALSLSKAATPITVAQTIEATQDITKPDHAEDEKPLHRKDKPMQYAATMRQDSPAENSLNAARAPITDTITTVTAQKIASSPQRSLGAEATISQFQAAVLEMQAALAESEPARADVTDAPASTQNRLTKSFARSPAPLQNPTATPEGFRASRTDIMDGGHSTPVAPESNTLTTRLAADRDGTIKSQTTSGPQLRTTTLPAATPAQAPALRARLTASSRGDRTPNPLTRVAIPSTRPIVVPAPVYVFPIEERALSADDFTTLGPRRIGAMDRDGEGSGNDGDQNDGQQAQS